MSTQESCLGHVDKTGWAKQQALKEKPPQVATYDEQREYVSLDPEQERLEQASMSLGQVIRHQLPQLQSEVA